MYERQGYHLDPSRNWTAAQRTGVLDRSGSMIVSAAAGTGKTAVLTERCVSLVCGPEQVDIDRLLVVTFTEAAALEMRDRIRKRLRDLYEANPTGRLTRQLALLDAASISTLHSFCLQVVRENFSTAGIEPDAGVLDDDEAQLLKNDVLADLFEGLYNGQDDRSKGFIQFVAHYGMGRDESIRGYIKHMHEYLRSLPPPQRDLWKNKALAAYALEEGETLTAEQFGQLREALVEDMDLLLEMGRVYLDAFRGQVGPHKGLENGQAVQTCVENLRSQLETVTTATALRQWIELARNLPRGRVSTWGGVSNACKGWARWLHDNWDKIIGDRWLVGPEAWAHGTRLTAGYAELLVWLVNQFEQRYNQAKRQIGKIDYGDMEEHAFALLAGADGKGSDIARSFQHRYDYVLVDEFQDTNPIQAAIVQMVCRESAETGRPNLFVVGDVKQSIYGFRMTDPSLFLKRQELIAGGRIAGRSVALQENFRSRPEVLEAVKGHPDRFFGWIFVNPVGPVDPIEEIERCRQVRSIRIHLMHKTAERCRLGHLFHHRMFPKSHHADLFVAPAGAVG